MTEEQKLPRPSVEKLNEYDELCKKLCDQQLTDEQSEELMDQLNDIIGEYDLRNYTFDDPATGKIGVKNPAGIEMVPAEYDDFNFIGDNNFFTVSHMAAKKDGKWGVVMADGSRQGIHPQCTDETLRTMELLHDIGRRRWQGRCSRYQYLLLCIARVR